MNKEAQSAAAVRAAAERALAEASAGRLLHWTVDLDRLEGAATLVAEETRRNYPDLRVPYHSRWRHFETGGRDRWGDFAKSIPAEERPRAAIGLAIVSVLLDAGAGAAWRYREAASGSILARSEGLAVASFDLVASGIVSDDRRRPWRIVAAGLHGLSADALGRAFQASRDNPLLGLDGRAGLLHRLGDVLAQEGYGDLDALASDLLRLARDGVIEGEMILAFILAKLGPIWPDRPNGDCWPHPRLGLVPFHKLSQWLAYSLFEPLEWAGFRIAGADRLTGLPEYRNGGLFIDTGVLVPRNSDDLAKRHEVGEPMVVEWRALTVALLDRLAAPVRQRLGLDAAAFPLARLLQGGSWSAGRRLARDKRPPDGPPPIQIDSDGTVF